MKKIQIGDRCISTDSVFSLVQQYQLVPQLLRGLVIDQAIAQWQKTSHFNITEAEQAQAIEAFCQQQQMTTPEAQAAWLQRYGIDADQLIAIAYRAWLIEQFKAATWTANVEAYFLNRKSEFDQVIYSLIRTKDAGLANELYFRILESEQSFAELARQYSAGPEAQTGGLLGPVSLTQPHPAIAKLLSISQSGQLWAPRLLGEWFVIVRLEKFLPAQLDTAMRRYLINEQFEQWVQAQIQQTQVLDSSLGMVSS